MDNIRHVGSCSVCKTILLTFRWLSQNFEPVKTPENALEERVREEHGGVRRSATVNAKMSCKKQRDGE